VASISKILMNKKQKTLIFLLLCISLAATAFYFKVSKRESILSFDIIDKSEGDWISHVEVDLINKRYRVTSTYNNEKWTMWLLPKIICFKKEKFTYIYCAPEKISATSLFDYILGFSNSTSSIELFSNHFSVSEDRIASWWPNNFLAALFSRVGAALELHQIHKLSNESLLKYKDGEKSYQIGSIENMRIEEKDISEEIQGVDLIRVADYCININLCPLVRFEQEKDDSDMTSYGERQNMDLIKLAGESVTF
jgi:hypothetical protein